MTALKKFDRLEATGLWRATPDEQRREVVVCVGDATLVIKDMKDQPLAHWSLAAISRRNPDMVPALFSPDGDTDEQLELSADEAEMIGAIETLRSAVDKTRPRPGRLRLITAFASALSVLALLVFWLPGALISHTVSLVPDIKRASIGAALLARIERVSGPACALPEAQPILTALARRTGVGALTVLPAGLTDTLHLPGGMVLLNRALIEDFEAPDVVAAYIVIEKARADQTDPLRLLLEGSGPFASFRLLTTGRLSPDTLDAYAEQLLTTPRPDLSHQAILAALSDSDIRSAPYAYAVDITGESVINLIEADPMAGQQTVPILADQDWVQLQAICEG